MSNNFNRILFFFIFAIPGYYLIVHNMWLSPNDDFNLVNSIENLKYYFPYSDDNKYYNPISFGRFTPLTAMEYNLIFLISGNYSVKSIFITHYIQFLIFELFIIYFAVKYSISFKKLLIINLLIILTPGFSTIFLKTQLNERNIFILSIIISYLFMKIYQKPEKKILSTCLLCFFSILYLLYKEISFIQLISLGFLILFLKNKNSNVIFYSLFNIIISIIFLIYYFTYVGGEHIDNYSQSKWSFIQFTKIFIHYILYDPIIFILLVPGLLVLILKRIINKDYFLKDYEVLCISSLAIIIFYIYKPINSQYYFISIYGFSIPLLFNYLKNLNSKNFNRILIFPFLIYLLNSLPISLHNYSYLKNNSKAFNDIMIKTSKIYEEKFLNKETMTVSLSSLKSGSGIFTYYIYEIFLCYYLKNCKDLDLISDMKWDIKNANKFPYIVGNNTNLSIYKNITKPISEIDILILGNFFYLNINSNNQINKELLINDYNLKEYYCTNLSYIPDYNLKELLRYFSKYIKLKNNYFNLSEYKHRIKDPNFCLMVNKNI
jgi:hypothetical protein